MQFKPLNDPKDPCKVSIGKTHIYQHAQAIQNELLCFLLCGVQMTWAKEDESREKSTNREAERVRFEWKITCNTLKSGEKRMKQEQTKSRFKGHLNTCRLQIVPRWRQMISAAQISVSNVSYLPLVAAWQFINLHVAKDHVSPLTLQTGLCSARKRGSIHHVLHTVWHQLETRSPPFEKPFAWRMWLLLVGANEPSQFMRREMSSLALLCCN